MTNARQNYSLNQPPLDRVTYSLLHAPAVVRSEDQCKVPSNDGLQTDQEEHVIPRVLDVVGGDKALVFRDLVPGVLRRLDDQLHHLIRCFELDVLELSREQGVAYLR